MCINTEFIIQVLSNYLQHFDLSEQEQDLLRSWLLESGANEDLFDDISNEAKWIHDCPPNIPHDLAGSLQRIRARLIENSES